jgi:hypothetical protein
MLAAMLSFFMGGGGPRGWVGARRAGELARQATCKQAVERAYKRSVMHVRLRVRRLSGSMRPVPYSCLIV